MLRKLLKYEWRATRKVMLVMDCALILLTLIGCGILNTTVFDHKDAAPMAILMVTLYTLSLMAFGIATLIYLYLRFYRNLFATEGYLMHTLPVSPLQLFHAKLIVGYLWTLLNTALIILSVLSLAFVAGYHFAGTGNIEQWISVQGTFPESLGADFTSIFYGIFGYSPQQFLLQLLWVELISSFSCLLTGYVSILLGQLVEKYKLMASVGFYIALYIINQMVCSVVMIVPGLRILVQDTDNFLFSYYRNMMDYAIFSQILIGIIFYVMALFLMRRPVNLD